MSLLFSPLTIKSITLKNRLVISPMCQYSAEDGMANDWHLVHLGSRAVGGASLIMQEATAVSPEGRITAGDLGLWNHKQIEKLQAITRFIKAQGAIAGIQLAHAGRKASCAVPWLGGNQIAQSNGGWQTVSASNLPFYPADEAPIALTTDDIIKVVSDFKAATERALEAGYQVIEIHAAHGYLIHQFLSPYSNHRTDAYGGSFDNRIRLLLEIVDAINTVWPAELPFFVRLSATDWVENAWDEQQTVQLSTILKNKRVDVIDCSTGGNVPGVKIPIEAGYQVPFAKAVKHQAYILSGAVGLITTATQAEAILQNQEADLIFIARASLRNAYFGLDAAKALGEEIAWPNQYVRAN
ncbi:NADH:flavin oxidoreductase/NADH oxidase [Parasediminibacterium paludis]|uniref:NADH:flavin oxidoreductase/NADH oxidase n=1 Tax=Parasediminibacterium paludis TaxID=908966 RepID=A0ABV8Q090_9BACT